MSDLLSVSALEKRSHADGGANILVSLYGRAASVGGLLPNAAQSLCKLRRWHFSLAGFLVVLISNFFVVLISNDECPK